MNFFTRMSEFLQSHREDMFMFWVYRRMFTPYEQQQAFSDESIYEDSIAQIGFIKECVPMGNGDFLIGIQCALTDTTDCDESVELSDKIEYYRLSEIRLNLIKK